MGFSHSLQMLVATTLSVMSELSSTSLDMATAGRMATIGLAMADELRHGAASPRRLLGTGTCGSWSLEYRTRSGGGEGVRQDRECRETDIVSRIPPQIWGKRGVG